VSVGFFFICIWYKKEKKEKGSLKVKAVGSSLIVLSAIYAIVAGFAITEALSNYANALSSPHYFHNTALLFAFFLVASSCYLGATFFLSYDADPNMEIDPKDEENRDRLRFITFIISFLQAVFLFLMSRAMASIDLFVTWLILLYFFNFVWSIIYLPLSHYLKLKNRLPLKEILPKAPLQWIPLNFMTMLFLLVYVAYPHPVNSDWSMVFVLFGSTLSDYYIAWRDVYSNVIRLS
jgi:hypothetical protein